MFRRPLKLFKLVLIVVLTVYSLKSFLDLDLARHHSASEILSLVENPLEILNIDVYPRVKSYKMKDWHDYEFMAYEATRVGLGENGTKVILTDSRDTSKNNEALAVEGLSGHISDLISVNRSVPDTRHFLCRRKLYLERLPHVTVIVIFHNEIPSLVKRTLHSIVNRSPRELLDEIVLVNDASTKQELYEPFEIYLEQHFRGIVSLVKLEKRVGLINARMEGFKRAKSEVVVFLDSHVEVNVNWLVPLIEPIAMNPRACTIPIHDRFNSFNFAYESFDQNGVRGLFAWDFDYRVVKRSMYLPTMPKSTPIMLGCAFAINRKYFEHLGGYDEGLAIWNGENYELSLKLHLCGGELLEVPCSRVAHVFRSHNIFRRSNDGIDFVARNFKRIAEVWLDDWKKFLYKSNESRFAAVEPGDLTKQKAIRRRLNCKPFDHFVHWVAPEMTRAFAVPRDDDVAYGELKVSNGTHNFCISDRRGKYKTCALDECDKSAILPYTMKFFHYHLTRGIEHDRSDFCFEKKRYQKYSDYNYKKNIWKYNSTTNQIVHEGGFYCIQANFQNMTLQLMKCNSLAPNQSWHFGFVNKTMVNELNLA